MLTSEQQKGVIKVHTPGPWAIRRLSSTIRIFCAKGAYEEVCEIKKSAYIDAAKKRKEADAFLIAAAPDLLAALKYSRNLIGPDEIIDTAISKASSC